MTSVVSNELRLGAIGGGPMSLVGFRKTRLKLLKKVNKVFNLQMKKREFGEKEI